VDPCCLGNNSPAALPSYWKNVKMQIGAHPENPGRTGRNCEAKQGKLLLSTLSVIHFSDRGRVGCCGHTGFYLEKRGFVLMTWLDLLSIYPFVNDAENERRRA
jgi:hypothetical protein